MKVNRRAVLSTAVAAAVGCARVTSIKPPVNAEDGKVEMKSRPLVLLRLATAAVQDLGMTPAGRRVTFPIIGGVFEGERLSGKILPGGADWTLQRSDGVTDLDLRITLETHDSALVYMTLSGLRDDVHGYFRTVARFETAAPEYAFLNRLLAAGAGRIEESGPVHVFDEIL